MRRSGKIGWFLHDVKNRGVTAWLISGVLLLFYVLLYFTEELQPLVKLLGFDKKPFEGKWTLYGLLYTFAILTGGGWMLYKYRHNKYQIVRTIVVMFVQTTLAFSVPIWLNFIDQPAYYFSYLWPLKIEYFYPSSILWMPIPFIVYSILGSLILVPVLGIFFGKRWYCSWVCGCGGLANTFGEPWRHLTSKSEASWKFEKYSIHITLVFSILTTALVVISYGVGTKYPEFVETTKTVQKTYGLLVSSILSGVVGVGLYPIGGTRIWCRNFCPMAAFLGLIQKFGRFRITVKENMCISCGMCTKYCEMGIDVRAYAQRNQSFVRASCVGCGLCAEVCPRGVLRLENSSEPHPQELTMNALIHESWKQQPHRKAL